MNKHIKGLIIFASASLLLLPVFDARPCRLVKHMNTFAYAAPVYPCNKVEGYYPKMAAEIMNTQACKTDYSLVFKAGVEGTSWVRYIYGPAEYILLGSPSLALSITRGGPLGLGKKILWDSVENIIKVAFRHPEKASKKVAKATYDMGLKAYRENYKLYKKHKKGEALSEDEARRFVINWYVQSYMVAAKKLYNDVTSYEKKDDFKNVPQLALQQFESLAIGSAKDSFGPLGEIEVSGLLKLTKGQFTVIESVIGQSAGLGVYPPYQSFRARMSDLDNQLREAIIEAEAVPRQDGLIASGRSILIILDTSGSMKDSLPGSGETKIDSARKAVQRLLDTTAGPVEWALMIFDDCRLKIAVDLTPDAARITDALGRIRARGSTPLAAALGKAGQYLQQNGSYITCDVVLLSDGEDTCGGNPVQAAQDLYGQSIDFEQWMKP